MSQTDILRPLFTKYRIQDTLPKIQKYIDYNIKKCNDDYDYYYNRFVTMRKNYVKIHDIFHFIIENKDSGSIIYSKDFKNDIEKKYGCSHPLTLMGLLSLPPYNYPKYIINCYHLMYKFIKKMNKKQLKILETIIVIADGNINKTTWRSFKKKSLKKYKYTRLY